MEKIRDGKWRSYDEAREYVRGLGLLTEREWQDWAKSSSRPDDIPADPSKIYASKGWENFGNWLGTDHIANGKRVFRLFEEAREYVRSLGLRNQKEWKAWAKSEARPEDIPSTPIRVYRRKGWVSLGDWLGTNRIAFRKMVYRPFPEGRAYVRSLGLKNYYEWVAWVKSPEHPKDIPAGAHRTYKGKGWAGWGDWLGTGRIYKKKYPRRTFEDARDYVRSLSLKRYSGCETGVKVGYALMIFLPPPGYFTKEKVG